jgi:hypothetical protein
MKRFYKGVSYKDKEGYSYFYEGKYRGFYQFYKFLPNYTPLETYTEAEVLELGLTVTENSY